MSYTFTVRTAAATLGLALACALPVQAAPVSGQGTWETTLLGRDINRNAVAATDSSAVYLYDTSLGVTWLRNANVNGSMTWANANTWAANLSKGAGANTIDDWRLPTMTDAAAHCNVSYGGTNCGFNSAPSSSEMASLFFTTLGNKSFFNTSGVRQAGYGWTNTGSFQNMRGTNYWLGTEYRIPDRAFIFITGSGLQDFDSKVQAFDHYALAVRPGDVLVSAVPEPETYLMMLLGLGAVGAVTRRRKQKSTKA